MPAETKPLIFARDEAGNEATAPFWYRLFPKKFRTRDFVVTDDFIGKVTRELGSSDFLRINRDLRRQNNQQLAALRSKTEEKFLWSQPFRQLADSKVEAQFADHRRYFHQGRKIDEQDHLGFDLAVTANVPVLAANDGKVVHAGYFGIYGNTVLIDHGAGMITLPRDRVDRAASWR